jgi:hypothetical protein
LDRRRKRERERIRGVGQKGEEWEKKRKEG